MRSSPTAPSLRLAGLLLAAPLLAVLSVACSRPGPAPADVAPPQAVTTMTLATQPWNDEIEALGTAHANESVTLTAKITETVRKVNFRDGQAVEAGDVLVELTSGQQVAALAEAQATARDADTQFRRYSDLVGQGTVSKSVFDTAQATRDSARARVDLLRATLADRVVSAPFAGVLGLRQVSPGALVTPGTVITTLDDVATIKLDFTLPETYLAAVEPGQAVSARSVAFPGRTFDGEVTSLDSRVDPATRAVQVRARLPNPDRVLRPGMLLSVTVRRPAREALVVPEIAIVQVGRDAYVYRVGADDGVEQVKVQLGARRRGAVEIVSGVEVGERIVVEGTGKLRAGTRIVETAAPETTPAPAAQP